MSASQGLVDLARTSSGIEYKVANSREERESAFRLVYDSYLQAGLGEPNEFQMRVTPYHLLRSTEVFIAVHEGDTAFTVSLISDGELGLPMENVYSEEVRSLREQGLRVGEVSCLADRRSEYRQCFPVFLKLCRLTVQYAWSQGLDQLLVAVHPRHARFYRRFMEFEPLGELKSYPSVRNRPAVALSLDMNRLQRERTPAYETLFTPAIPDEQFTSAPLSFEESEFFGSMIDSTFDCAPLSGDEDIRRSERVAVGV